MADPKTSPPLTRSSVEAAHELIKPFVHFTPVITCSALDKMASTARTAEELGELGPDPDPQPREDRGGGGAAAAAGEEKTGGEVKAGNETEDDGKGKEGREMEFAKPTMRLYFKCENLQKVGAFKARGAFHAVERLKMVSGGEGSEGWEEVKKRGVVTHSSGNHAAALTLAAATSHMPAHIVMPIISPRSKIAATRGYGANIIFSGSTSQEREAVCKQVQQETGAALIPPYDHPDVVLGQGTLGLELQEQAAELVAARRRRDVDEATAPAITTKEPKHLDAIIAPCSGGGMLSGVALSCSLPGSNPPVKGPIRVFGAEPSFQGADDLCRSLRSGKRIVKVKSLTIADGLRTPVGDVPWYLIHDRGLVESAYSATESQIKASMRLILERAKLVVEPSAAVPLAVILYNEEFRSLVAREAGPEGWDVGVVLSGGNCSVDRMVELFS